jgi:hypothetical protein
MNFWDVTNQVLTLSVTSFVAFRVAKMSRQHDDKRDRRKVRQDAAQAIAELFEQTHADILNEFALMMSEQASATLPIEERQKADRDLLRFKEESIGRYSRIGLSLGVIRVKLMMLKSPTAISALTEYVKYFDDSSGQISRNALAKQTIVNETIPKLRSLAKPFQTALVEIADL